MEFSGFFGIEVIKCKKCGKEMVDLFSPLRTGNATAAILDDKKFKIEGNRYWIANDKKGGIMINKKDENHE